MGPWLVTADEIPDPQALGIRQRINGAVLQESHTSKMIFRIASVLADLSRVLTLEPGDVISTGTPGGIGSARQPPVLLRGRRRGRMRNRRHRRAAQSVVMLTYG
jgi:2-keto-4-pentenoate hydratase/2-oxohepta-3-ene-1,7-dioic acid hydratase in catechol pathway